MRQTILTIIQKRDELKALKKSIQAQLRAEPQYADMLHEQRLDREASKALREKLIGDSPSLSDAWRRAEALRGEISNLNASLASMVRPSLAVAPDQMSLFESLDIKISVK